MDFVSRHAATPSDHTPPAHPPSSSSPATPPEEPEYLARYMVIKHSWRGRYKRILCISNHAIITLDPSTLSMTNSYDVSCDFEGAAPIIGRDDNSNEFNISVRTDGRGKFKAIKFSSKYRASILTELHRIRWNRLGAIAEFPVLHLRRRTSEWVPFKMKVTYVGVEVIDLKSGDLRWCLDFRDMDSPAIVLLGEGYGRKGVDHGGFVLCSLYGRKSKAFQAASGTSNATIVSNLTKTAVSMIGVSLVVDSSQSLTITEYMKRRAKEAVGAEETPLGGWSVTRLRTAAHGMLHSAGLSLAIGPKGGLGDSGDAVSRQLILTKVSLVERRPENYEAMLSGEPTIVDAAAALLKAIVTRNPKAMIRLYSTGAFYFSLAYPGSNLLSIAQLFSVTHVYQAFHGGEEAAVSSSLPLAKRSVLGGLLPESLLYVLERSGPVAFAAAMVSDSDTPEIIWTHKMRAENLIRQIIWNSSTRAELLKFVEEQRASLSHDGSYDLKDSHSFVYEALSKELYIGNVYLRVYNDQPDFEITEPEDFCLALVDFISHLVHNAPAASMDTHVNGDVTTDASAEQHSSDDSSASLDGKSSEREDLELVKNLQYGLLSLQHLLTKNPNLASVVSTKEKLLPLFECFSLPVASSSNIPQLCLLVLSRLTTYAPCVEAMVADSSGLLILLQLLHSSPSCREGALHVLYALASTAELAWAAAKHGGVVFILEVLLPIQEEIPLQQRAAAASLLGKLVGQTMHGPRVAITLARFLPDGLVSVIRDGPGEAVVAALEQTTETPELVWTPAMAASLSAQIATMASDLYREGERTCC
ncbi:UNVERIFIED_CONTAM: DnaJsubfamily C GRV2 [Sesamum radiatum]|uniref:DnaJsubfamily C GRV2 n=1 Tax=Sesamum radiatum TaxID=300843 RepID=A0AAW2N931_SESRA